MFIQSHISSTSRTKNLNYRPPWKVHAMSHNRAFSIFLFSLKPHTAWGVLWSYLKLQRTTWLSKFSRVSRRFTAWEEKRLWQKTHSRRPSSALGSPRCENRSDARAAICKAPRTDRAVAESKGNVWGVSPLRTEAVRNTTALFWTGSKHYFVPRQQRGQRAMLPSHRKRAWKSHRGSLRSPAISPSRWRTIWWPWLAWPWPDPSA